MEYRLEDVCFGYGGHQVLRNIELTLEGPGLYCIIGPNGVGKSTLVKCLNKLNTVSSGRILLDGADISDIGLGEVAKKVGYVPANSSDCFSMPVVDAVLIGRHNKRKWKTSPEDIEAVNSALRLLGLEEFAMCQFNELSAGQHQRVALARGLVRDTEILILDEPTANLDVKHQVYVTQMLKAIANRRNRMIIMICHDLNIAARYADKLIFMAPPGMIEAVGTPSEILTEERIRRIYGIDCEILMRDGSPHVILRDEFTD